jgi:hypothetical protein
MEFFHRHSVELGVASMALLVLGTLAPAGSVEQRLLFLLPAPVLGYTAHVAGQRMFKVLQAVVSVGALLAFFDGLSPALRYGLLVGCALAGVWYLVRSGYSRVDRWWPLGGAGIVLLSFGYSTDASAWPLAFNLLLASGGLLVAAYSAVSYLHLRVRVAFIWLALNVLFVLRPLAEVASLAPF